MADDQQQQTDQQADQQQQQTDQQQTDQQQDQRSQAPAWQTSLTKEDLRGDETLARYKSVDDLATGHLETLKWARGRVPLPAADDEKGRLDFVAKARPDSADAYEIALPEGQTDTTMADGFRAKAFDLGLMPWQAKELGDWWNAQAVDAASKAGQGALDQLKERELNLGPAAYARAQEGIAALFDGVDGVERDSVLKGLESAYGAGPAFDFLLKMARKTGELDKVDGAAISLRLGTTTPDAAQQWLDDKMGDREFMAKAERAGTPENKQWEDHLIIASKRMGA
jgi:hypothetical protein